jgi:hypothetical protein
VRRGNIHPRLGGCEQLYSRAVDQYGKSHMKDLLRKRSSRSATWKDMFCGRATPAAQTRRGCRV